MLDPQHLIVFVGGLHRSGTSLLLGALGAHPDASRFPGRPAEGQFLQSVYPRDSAFGGPGCMGFDQRAHMTELSPLVTEANRAKLLEEWGSRWDMTKPVLVEKSPPNLLKTRFLQAFFPRALFVVIVRHPIAVTLATKKLWGGSVENLVEHWLLCHEIFMRDVRFLRRAIVVRYEDLIGDPGCFPKLLTAIGLHPTAPLGDYAKQGLNEVYFDQWQPDRALRELLRTRFESGANRFGYSLVEPERRDISSHPDFERLLNNWPRGISHRKMLDLKLGK